MASPDTPHPLEGLETPEHLAFQKEAWRIQYVAQGFFALLIVCGLAGLFGRGGFSETTLQDSSGSIKITYPRFVRAHSPFTIEVEAQPALIRDGTLDLQIHNEALDVLRVTEVVPAPKESLLDGEMVRLRFQSASVGAQTLRIYAQAQRMGQRTLTVRATDSELKLNVFVYP